MAPVELTAWVAGEDRNLERLAGARDELVEQCIANARVVEAFCNEHTDVPYSLLRSVIGQGADESIAPY